MIKNKTITIFTFIFLSLIVFSCKKDSNQPEVEHNIIEAYVADNNLNGEFTSSGLYYVIENSGSDNHPNINSEVIISYVGYDLNGNVFDNNDFKKFWLYQFIAGWQEGLQLIGEGGKIKLIIPSALAYGSDGAGSIGSNEILVFDITLHSLTDHNLISAYVSENQLDGEFTSSGLYYVIDTPGSANHPTINSQVTVSYVGYTLDGAAFDDGDFVPFRLYQVIEGWQEGIQLIGEGGQIKLIIPSVLAFGPNGSGSIGPNEVLVFDVTLHYFLDK